MTEEHLPAPGSPNAEATLRAIMVRNLESVQNQLGAEKNYWSALNSVHHLNKQSGALWAIEDLERIFESEQAAFIERTREKAERIAAANLVAKEQFIHRRHGWEQPLRLKIMT